MSASTDLGRPPLSVVIATHDAAAVIRPCLAALEAQSRRSDFEIIVADSSSDGTDAIVATEFPAIRLLRAGAPAGVPQLRGAAIGVAAGSIIAILDPFSVADDGWAAAVIDAHQRFDNLVIGGSVDLFESERRGLVEWAIYFNEYGMFLPPIEAGRSAIVPGSNVSYKRACLFDRDRPRHETFWKTFVNDAAERAGSPLRLEPSIRVSLNKPIRFGDFLRTRVWHGRCYAGTRVANASLATRCLRAGTTPILPLVLCARWTRAFWPKRQRRGTYLLTLPLQLLLFAAWACGEGIGYLRGPGRTCEQLYY